MEIKGQIRVIFSMAITKTLTGHELITTEVGYVGIHYINVSTFADDWNFPRKIIFKNHFLLQERKATDWEKIFAICILDKGLIYRTSKELL